MPLRPGYTEDEAPYKLTLSELVGWVGFDCYYVPPNDGSPEYAEKLHLAVKDVLDALRYGKLAANAFVCVLNHSYWENVQAKDFLGIAAYHFHDEFQGTDHYWEIFVRTDDVHRIWPPNSVAPEPVNSVPPELVTATEETFVAWATAEYEKHGLWPPTDAEKTGQRQGWRRWAAANGVERETVWAWVESHGFKNPVGRRKSGK